MFQIFSFELFSGFSKEYLVEKQQPIQSKRLIEKEDEKAQTTNIVRKMRKQIERFILIRQSQFTLCENIPNGGLHLFFQKITANKTELFVVAEH